MHPLYRKVFVQTIRNLYLLDMNTGKTIQKFAGGRAWNWKCYEQGYVDYDQQAGVLRYINGATGKTTKTVPLKLGQYTRLYVADQDLLFVTWYGRESQLLCYSGPALLGQ